MTKATTVETTYKQQVREALEMGLAVMPHGLPGSHYGNAREKMRAALRILQQEGEAEGRHELALRDVLLLAKQLRKTDPEVHVQVETDGSEPWMVIITKKGDGNDMNTTATEPRDGCCVSTMSGGPCMCPTTSTREGR